MTRKQFKLATSYRRYMIRILGTDISEAWTHLIMSGTATIEIDGDFLKRRMKKMPYCPPHAILRNGGTLLT